MAKTRDAVDTIRGYYYQFDLSILKILQLKSEDDTVTIEGIEDVDIHSENKTIAIQCKYYEGTEYNHSKISEPIRLMLKHFKEHSGKTIEYYLYGFYKSGQDKLALPITVNFLKEHFLTYTHDKTQYKVYDELSLSDQDLQSFINLLKIDINAQSFSEQESKVMDAIKTTFNCNDTDSRFYYRNSLCMMRQLAASKSNRIISKKQFIKSINNKQELFDNWFCEYKGIKKYCNMVKTEYFLDRLY